MSSDEFSLRTWSVQASTSEQGRKTRARQHRADRRGRGTGSDIGAAGACAPGRTPSRAGRPFPPGRAGGAVHRHADDRPRRDRGERGAPIDPERPRLLSVEPRLGGQRLPDRLRWPAPAGRATGRPRRPQEGLPRRARPVHPGVHALRPRKRPGDAGRRQVRAGRGWGFDLGRDPRHDRDDVPRAQGAGRRPSASMPSSRPPEVRSACWPAVS